MDTADAIKTALHHSLKLHLDASAQYAATLLEHGFAREATLMASAAADHEARVGQFRQDLAELEAGSGAT